MTNCALLSSSGGRPLLPPLARADDYLRPMKKIIAGLGLLYFARNGFNRRRRMVLRRQRRGIVLAGFGAVAMGVWIGFRAMQQAEEARPRQWTSRKKQRREVRIAEAKAREQTTVRPPEVHVERGADPSLKVRLGDI